VGDIVALASVLNVALNIWGFHGLFGWLDAVLLNQERIDGSGDQRGNDETGYTDDRQAPAAIDHGRDEQPDDQDGGNGQDGRRRNDGVDIRIQCTGPVTRLILQGFVAVEPVAPTLEQHVQGSEDQNVEACGTFHGDAGAVFDADTEIGRAHV